MTDAWTRATALEELSRIDYFLDQIARGVESGEVPLESYERMAPRYLARREHLVEVLAAETRPLAPVATPVAAPGGVPGAGPARGAPLVHKVPRERKPVSWTTVLIFLGALLVIIASATFAFYAWDIMGATARLGFLGLLTVGFYVAGFFVRRRLKLKTGGVALTVVGSAMLLFVCWILIDGFRLPTLLSWSAALFVLSLVYWFTEISLGDRFYGVAGAAAQVGWWWMMTAGLHQPVAVRLGGIALIALVWQLVAERARESETFGPLARLLLWAAPVVELLAVLGAVSNLLLIGESTWTLAGWAAAVSASGAVVAMRSKLFPAGARRWIAAAAQIAVVLAILLGKESSWIGVGILAMIAAAYSAYALLETGLPFAVLGLGIELLAVSGAAHLLHANERTSIGVLAVLAVTWAIASRLAWFMSTRPQYSRVRGSKDTATVAEWAGFGLLVLMSIGTVGASSDSLPALTGARTASGDVVLGGVVLACWAAASLGRRRAFFAGAAVLWSFQLLAALEGWAYPALHAVTYAIGLLGLAGVWLASRTALERYYRLPAVVTGWAMRALSLLIVFVGLVAEEVLYPSAASWLRPVLVLAGALIFLADATFGGPEASAAAAGSLPILATAIALDRPGVAPGVMALGGAASGALVAFAGGALRARWGLRARVLACSAAIAATIACGVTDRAAWYVVGALLLAASAWAAAGYATRLQWFSLPVGVLALCAVLVGAATANGTWPATVAAISAACLLLGAVGFLSRGQAGRYADVSRGFAVAAVAGLALITVAAWTAASDAPFGPEGRWFDLGPQGVAILLFVLGAIVVTQAMLWHLEGGYYIGGFVILLGLFAQLDALDVTTPQLYTTPLALYIAGMGYLYASLAPGRRVPVVLDAAAVLVGAGLPALAALGGGVAGEVFRNLAWTLVLGLALITAGIILRVRWYLFGGAVVLALVFGWRSLVALAGLWWAVLGIVGVAMLVIALTWEWQRQLISDARHRFETWR